MEHAAKITKIRGISAVGAESPDELLLLVPKGCADYRATPSCQFQDEEPFCGPVQVTSKPEKHPDRPMWTFQVKTQGKPDGVVLRASIFGAHPKHMKDWPEIHPGRSMILKGVVRQFGRNLYLSQVVHVPHDLFGRIMPVYRSVPKVISGERLQQEIQGLLKDSKILLSAVEKLHQRLGEASPGHATLSTLIQALHAPGSIEEHEAALQEARKLSAEAIIARGRVERCIDHASSILLDWFDVQAMKDRLPFALTPSQDKAVEGIIEELESTYPMNAMLSGDVGSGKTVTYGLPAVAAWKAGKRVGILVPNTPLATQIAHELRSLFPETAIALLTGNCIDGAPDQSILVGTTAMMSYAKRTGWRADFLIIDEQQKFSLEQKQFLTHEATNILESTATCIPHTLGMVKHGGMRIFRLEGHVGKRILTRIVGSAEKKFLLQQLQKTIQDGDRAVIIYPQIATGEDDFRRNAMAAAKQWESYFPGKVVAVHGRMKDEEKIQALDEARHGDKPVLVTTSIIEVGITVPRLRMGIVVSAERYGISTLHQMRGRLARDGGEGFFYPYLPFDIDNPNMPDEQLSILERLKILERSNDGFELAEFDAERRGFGDILHSEGGQHGKTTTPFLGLTLSPEDFRLILSTDVAKDQAEKFCT